MKEDGQYSEREYDLKVLFFGKVGCNPCKSIRASLDNRNISYTYYNVSKPDGMTEACYYDLNTFPVVLVVDNKGNRVKKFIGISCIDRLEQFLKGQGELKGELK